MAEPHVLVVSYASDDDEYPEFDLECPGVTDACMAWRECTEDVFPCNADRDQVDVYEELLRLDDLVHGVEHRYWDGKVWVPTPSCFAAIAIHLPDTALDALDPPTGGRVQPGRYPVRVRADSEGDLELELIADGTVDRAHS